MINFVITISICYFVGFIFNKIKIPAAYMVGSIVGATVLSIGPSFSYMPNTAKIIAQIIAGTFIATTVKKEDIQKLKTIVKPLCVLIFAYLILTALMGFTIYFVSDIDLLTSLMSCIPGGISDVSIISAEMGADAAKVAVLQFIRLAVGLGLFPTIISYTCKNEYLGNIEEIEKKQEKITSNLNKKDIKKIITTLAIGFVSGIIGRYTKIPAGALIFSLVGVLIYIFSGKESLVPRSVKRFAQILAGAYIGCSINYSDILQMKLLVLPTIIMIIGYIVNCFIVGFIINKVFKISRKEAMLMATPAGASDMALISNDLGINSPNLVVIQIFRLISTVTIFPQYVKLLIYIGGLLNV